MNFYGSGDIRTNDTSVTQETEGKSSYKKGSMSSWWNSDAASLHHNDKVVFIA